MSALFAGAGPRLYSVPASAAFLDVLAHAMVEELRNEADPFALSDALVLLPNRRARGGLIDAFARRLGGAALLPAMRPLGDLDDDPEVWGAEPMSLDVAPEIAPTRQRLELAALIRARDAAEGGDGDAARALALADELRRVLDAAASADEVHWEKLDTIAREVDLAHHWESSAEFLKIVSEYWPQRLASEGLSDPSGRRAQVLRALAREWRERPPQTPVIIAGSTGSVAATRALMKVVMGLPRGCVVFPGLDSDLDDGAWHALGDQHPQFALKATLDALGVARGDVALLGEEKRGARRVLMREALAPAEKTADWLTRLDAAGGSEFVKRGAEGLSVLEAASEDEEAGAIALLLRECVETPGRDGALVTPDVALARRVAGKLGRWGIAPVVSHGMALRETEAGALIALICDLARDAGQPVALAALMKHPLAHFEMSEEALAAARTLLEREALRGPRRHETLRELAGLAKSAQAKDLAARLEKALAPLVEFHARADSTLSDFADALTLCAQNCFGGEGVWAGPDGEAAARLLEDIIAHGGELGALKPWTAPRAFEKLMQGREVPPLAGGEARIAIWGLLEARLQRRDLMVLGGLNEGVWPAPPPDDPFLSRAMRAQLGLPSPDARIGLAAHDFAQLVSGPNVVLTRALKRDGAPTVKSRWLWRLDALARGAGAEIAQAREALDWARALDAPQRLRPTPVPKPKPPASARIARISVTQVETLIRDPYAVYARRILGLEVLKAIGAAAEHAERGTAIHDAIEAFGDGDDVNALMALLDENLRAAGFSAERRAGERARLAASARVFVDWQAARRAAQVWREAKGELKLEGGVVLSGKADRLEIGADGAGVILDFKTGAPPSDKQVSIGLSPQLTLEAAMLARGAFKGVPKAKVGELIYWRFGGADPAPKPVKLDEGADAAGEAALRHLEALLKRYADPKQPFLSSPRVQFISQYRDYDHLARRKEWADAEGGE